MFQSSYTWAKSEDTTQASTFFSDATNGTTSAFPEFIPDYNRGLSDFHAEHNWVMNISYDLPFGRVLERCRGRAPRRLARGGHRQRAQRQSADGVRAEQPIAVAVAAVAGARDRPRSPELRAWLQRRQRRDRQSGAVVQSRGVRPAARGDDGEHWPRRLHRSEPPDRRSLVRRKTAVRVLGRWPRWSSGSRPSISSTARTSAPPQLIAFAGAADNEAPLASFGRVRNTITSARQVQLGVRVSF